MKSASNLEEKTRPGKAGPVRAATSKPVSAAGKRGKARPVDMEIKTQPLQERSRQTYDAILAAAGELLEEVGVEQLSTNLVCKRAGLTPPALYRYFPNKYALLRELGARLMQRQDDAVLAWIDNGGLESKGVEESYRKTLDIQQQVNEITRREPGGVWIMRAMRAVPALREVRIASRDLVADRVAEYLSTLYTDTSEEELRMAARLTTEVGYAATEMAIEEPDTAKKMTEELAWMISLYYAKFR
ncbi:TetR/AcrR family transcriptional regulator [Parvibaculum sp.]|uniref:TetR/AcrR family transcriptional regulator n=1 Tax=Parvibaculum sp. TaxID=2024848 RepID=UPI002CC9CDF8|nr:TetR/AcrR family transcriptional regulator [Parvibaculum sp.]HUD51101.1 TetR/AcrR family transcriptional regulator [Parvibaculum sp.]